MTDHLDVLVVDDQQPILDDFQQLLGTAADAREQTLDSLAALLGAGPATTRSPMPSYRLHLAQQGLEAVRLHEERVANGQGIAVAFVDIQMPPGIDGIETVAQLWRAQPDLEVVLCTAYSDYSWHSIVERLERRDQLVILRKPFDPIEVRQLAACLSEKWRRGRMLARRMELLEAQIQAEVGRRLEIELRHAQKFETLGRLAAGISHEINTPAQYIQTSLEFIDEVVRELDGTLASKRVDVDAARAAIAQITPAIADATHGVGRVTAIVRSVRAYAHSRQTGAPELVDVNAQIRLVSELARAQYKHDANLVLELADVPRVLGDADELGRALLNLIVNAAQAVQATGTLGCITVRTSSTSADVVVEIADTGVGIAREHWTRVFEPFFTTKPRGEGTGQGLAMARATIVDGHHGALTFDSCPGRGTTFQVRLPRALAHEAAA